MLFLFLGSYVDWVTNITQDQASLTDNQLLKIKDYQKRLIDAVNGSVDPFVLSSYLQEIYEKTFEKAIRSTSFSKSLDIQQLKKARATDGSLELSKLLLHFFFE